jgi:hypothetical protein
MRQVDEVHHAERDGEPDRKQEQQHPVSEAVEQDAEQRADHVRVPQKSAWPTLVGSARRMSSSQYG